MIESSYFFDSSAWLSYFYQDSEKIREIVDNVNIKIFTSVISISEIKRKLNKDKTAKEKQTSVYEFIISRAILVEITLEISNRASEYIDLHTVDALIYASAQKVEKTLLTRDNDFRNLNKVIII